MEAFTGMFLVGVGLLTGYQIGKKVAKQESASKINELEKMVEEAMFKKMPSIQTKAVYDQIMEWEPEDPKNWN